MNNKLLTEAEEEFDMAIGDKDFVSMKILKTPLKQFLSKWIDKSFEAGAKFTDDSYGDYANRMNKALFEAEKQAKQELLDQLIKELPEEPVIEISQNETVKDSLARIYRDARMEYRAEVIKLLKSKL